MCRNIYVADTMCHRSVKKPRETRARAVSHNVSQLVRPN
ncbi:hypothetical protein HKBW3S34_02237, partial [Candidatus Hakubella thermalkaliphila]